MKYKNYILARIKVEGKGYKTQSADKKMGSIADEPRCKCSVSKIPIQNNSAQIQLAIVTYVLISSDYHLIVYCDASF